MARDLNGRWDPEELVEAAAVLVNEGDHLVRKSIQGNVHVV